MSINEWNLKFSALTPHFQMKIKKNFLPRTLSDIAATAFLFVVIPITYFFEMWVVIPTFSEFDTLAYWIHFAIGSFVLFNILSNMLAVMMCNTSIVGETINAPARPNRKLWKLCAVCETVTPPRSWHCNTCNVCILKRDHHCFFTGNKDIKCAPPTHSHAILSSISRLLYWSPQSSLLRVAAGLLIHWHRICQHIQQYIHLDRSRWPLSQ